MEPFLETLLGPLVPICALLESLFFAINCYSSLLTAIDRYQALLIAINCQSHYREYPD